MKKLILLLVAFGFSKSVLASQIPTKFLYKSCSKGVLACIGPSAAPSNNGLFATAIKILKGSTDAETYNALQVQNFDGNVLAEVRYSGVIEHMAFSPDSMHLYYTVGLLLKDLDITTQQSSDIVTYFSNFPGIWLTDILPLNDGKNVLLLYKNGYSEDIFQVSLVSLTKKQTLWTKTNLKWQNVRLDSQASNLNQLLVRDNDYNRIYVYKVGEQGLETVYYLHNSTNQFLLDQTSSSPPTTITLLSESSSESEGIELTLNYYSDGPSSLPEKKIKLPYSFAASEYNRFFFDWILLNKNSAYGFVSTGKNECRVLSVDFSTSNVKELITIDKSCWGINGFKPSPNQQSGTFSDDSGNRFFFMLQ